LTLQSFCPAWVPGGGLASGRNSSDPSGSKAKIVTPLESTGLSALVRSIIAAAFVRRQIRRIHAVPISGPYEATSDANAEAISMDLQAGEAPGTAAEGIFLKSTSLDRMTWFGEAALRKGLQEFVLHYHHERNHQGLGNRLILPEGALADAGGTVQRRERLGGMLNYYYRAA
jgi:hypothetical protein